MVSKRMVGVQQGHNLEVVGVETLIEGEDEVKMIFILLEPCFIFIMFTGLLFQVFKFVLENQYFFPFIDSVTDIKPKLH